MRLKEFALAAVLGTALCPAPARAQLQPLYDLSAALANASVPIEILTAATTQLVPAPTTLEPNGGLQAISVTAFDVQADGTGNLQFVFGTGTNCGTGQGNLTGVYHLIAQARAGESGFGPVWQVPAGNAVCAVTSAVVGMHGSLAYRVK
jgi:hypothetical protein